MVAHSSVAACEWRRRAVGIAANASTTYTRCTKELTSKNVSPRDIL